VGGATGVSIVHDTVINGRTQTLPIRVEREVISLKFVMRCNSNVNPSRTTCNPVRIGTRGSSGYLPYADGYETVLHFNRNFDQNSEVALQALPVRASVNPLKRLDMDRIQVVPNPFIVQSSFDAISTGRNLIENRVRFVNVPAEGTVRIYTVSGQLVNQLTWTQADLVAQGNNSPHGDLPFNLRTREGLDLSSGLYLYVLTAKGANANGQVARGKFVVIR
jgi:hypothetical protein